MAYSLREHKTKNLLACGSSMLPLPRPHGYTKAFAPLIYTQKRQRGYLAMVFKYLLDSCGER
jgi:hypothetical protein